MDRVYRIVSFEEPFAFTASKEKAEQIVSRLIEINEFLDIRVDTLSLSEFRRHVNDQPDLLFESADVDLFGRLAWSDSPRELETFAKNSRAHQKAIREMNGWVRKKARLPADYYEGVDEITMQDINLAELNRIPDEKDKF